MMTSRFLNRLLALSRLFTCGLTLVSTAGVAAAEEPRDHVIFVGLELKLGTPQTTGQLVGIRRSSAILATATGPEKVSLHRVDRVEMERQMQIGRGLIDITGTLEERAFTPALDPKRLALEQTMDAIHVQEQRTVAALSAFNIVDAQRSTSPDGAQELSDSKARARNDVEVAFVDAQGSMGNAASSIHRAGEAGGTDKSDAYRVSFLASAPAPVSGAYAAFVVKFVSPGMAAEPASFVRFSELPEIGPTPRRVTVQCDGLPQGYHVVSYEIHLYDGAAELATSLSEKAVAVTRSEAFQYLVLRHQMENKGMDRPPQIVTRFLPGDTANRIPAAARGRAAEVAVGVDGHVTAVRLHRREAAELDDYVERVLHDALFLPALSQGQPVATETTVTFAELIP